MLKLLYIIRSFWNERIILFYPGASRCCQPLSRSLMFTLRYNIHGRLLEAVESSSILEYNTRKIDGINNPLYKPHLFYPEIINTACSDDHILHMTVLPLGSQIL